MKRWIGRFLAGAVVSAVILTALLAFAEPRVVVDLIARTNPVGATVAFTLYALAYVVRAHRLRAVGLHAPLTTLMQVACLHAAIGKLLPLRAGDLSYPWLARRAAGQSLGEGLIALVYLRVLDMVGVAVLFAGTLALNRALYRGDTLVSMTIALVLLAGSLAGLLWLFPLLRLAIAVLERLFGPRRLLERARKNVEDFPRLDLRAHAVLGALTVAAWLLVFGTFHALIWTFGVETSPAQTVLGATAGVVASVLPAQGLGSFGTMEAGWSLGMVLVGLDFGVAVATGIGVQLFTFSYAMLLGGWGWLGLRRLPRPGTAEQADLRSR